VLQRHANNMKVVRLYAKFLEHVKHGKDMCLAVFNAAAIAAAQHRI
jgi:hypothetical protein